MSSKKCLNFFQTSFRSFSYHFLGTLFSCPGQLNRWPSHSLSEWVSESGHFWFTMTTMTTLISTHQMLQEDQFDQACQVLLAEVLLRGYWCRFEGRAGRARLDKKSNGRETKSWVGRSKNPTKRKVFWGFAEYENLTFLELLYVLHDKSCETQWKKHYMQVMEGNKKPFLPKVKCILHKKNYFTKNNLFWNRF